MNGDTTIMNFLRTENWLRKEFRKASRLPHNKMIERIEQLVGRSKQLGREVNKFLEQKDAS